MENQVIDTKKMETSRDYEARGVIAKINQIGTISIGMIALPVYQFLTLDCGAGRDKILVELVGPAPYDQNQELDFNQVQEGDIIVNPGMLYRRRSWTGPLMTQHLIALKKYIPKVIVKAEVDKSEPTKEIVIDPHGLAKT